MIERLKESHGGVIGFKATGKITAEEVEAFEEQIKFLIAERRNRPIGIVADLSEMEGVDWKARWEEMKGRPFDVQFGGNRSQEIPEAEE